MEHELIYPIYYRGYVGRVKDDVWSHLEQQSAEVRALLRELTSEQWAFRYAPEKWTLWQSWRHVLDTERIMSTRALCILRGDKSPLPGYDQDAYAKTYPAVGDPIAILDEFEALRTASLLVLAKADKKDLEQAGTVSGQPMNALALCYILAGHVDHHLDLTRERYLLG